MADGERTLVWTAVLSTAGFQAGLNAIGSGINGVQNVVQTAANGITSTLSAAFNAVRNVVTTVASTITSVLSSAFNVVIGVVQAFIGVLTGGFGAIGNVISSVAGLITGLLGGAFNILSSIAQGAFSILTTAAQAAFQILTSIATISFEALAVGIMAVVAALGYLTVTGTKAYANIEDAATDTSNRIAAATGKSTAVTKQQYFDMAEAISKKTKFTAEDIGTSMSMMIARAMENNPNASVDQITQQILPVAKFAEAIHTPLNQAVNVVNTAMKQFNIPFSETQKTVDQLTTGMLGAQMSTEDYAGVLQTVGQFAAAAKVPLDVLLSQVTDLSTKMEPQQITMGLRMAYTKQREYAKDLTDYQMTLAQAQDKYNTSLDKYNEKIATGKAGTAPTLSSTLLKAGDLDAAKSAGEILDDLGFSVDDLKNKYTDTATLYGQVIEREKAMHRSDTDIMGDFDKLIGGGARGGGLAAYNLGLEHLSGNLDKVKGRIDNSTGAVNNATAAWDQNLNVAMEQTGKNISAIGETLGKVLGPKLTDFLNNTLIPTLGTVNDAFKNLLTGNWAGFDQIINGLIDNLKTNLTYQKAYDFGKWLMNSIAAGLKAITGIKWSGIWDTLKTGFVGAMEGIRQSIYENFGIDIAEIYNNYREMFAKILDSVGEFVSGFITGMEPVIQGALEAAGAIYEAIMWAMKQDYGTVLSTGLNVAGEAITAIFITVGAEIYNILKTSIDAAMAYIGGVKVTPGGLIDQLTNGQFTGGLGTGNGAPPEAGPQPAGTIWEPGPNGGGNWINPTTGLTVFTPQTNAMNPDYSSATSYGSSARGNNPESLSSAVSPIIVSPGASAIVQNGVQTNVGNGITVTTSTMPGNMPGVPTGGSSGYTSQYGGGVSLPYGNQKNIFSSIMNPSVKDESGLYNIPEVLKEFHEDWKKEFPLPTAATGTGTLQDAISKGMQEGNEAYINNIKPTMDNLADKSKGLGDIFRGIVPTWTSKLTENVDSTNKNGQTTADLLNEMANFKGNVRDNTTATQENTSATQAAADANNNVAKAASGGTSAASSSLYYESTAGMDNAAYAEEINRRIDYANMASQRGYAMVGSIQQYVGAQKITVDVDGNIVPLKTAVETETAAIESAKPEITVGANTQPAYNAVDAIIAYANSSSANINVGGGGTGAGYSGPVSYGSFTSPSNYQNTQGWAMPSYDTGTDYVPYDQVAKLHRGEAVLTAQENKTSTGTMSLTYAPTTIIGTRTDRAEVEKLVKDMQDKHSMEIEKMLVNKTRGNR